jgi:CPA2 family monovalent cation:H+ antiporter-2
MTHDISLVSMIAVGFALAFVLGYGASRLGLPPLVGYLLSGIVIGPHTPGFVADSHLAGQLAEIGVMLLMFGVGLHFSVSDLLAVRRIAIPGAIGQILIATAIGTGMAMMWGWSFGAGLILGLSLSVASTVVMLKALEERNAVASANGRIAVGWLIVEDLAMVLALVLIPAFAGALGGGAVGDAPGAPDRGLVATVGVTLLEVAAFVAVALLVGPRVMPWLLRQAARTGSRELFTLATLAAALGIAFASAELFGVSFALGAFFAGVVLSESELSHKAASNSLPLQDAFAVLFFVSVGMLFDPTVLSREPVRVLEVVGLILVGKSFVALGIVLALGYPLATGLVVSAALAQIGEFSFILSGLGITYRLLPQEGLNLILAGALISITLNPLVFAGADRACVWMRSDPRRKRWLDELGSKKFARLKKDLDASRERAAAAMATHKTFTPEELVERFPLFAGLTPEQREILILHFVPRSAQPGERIIRTGDKADAMYFISEGEAEVCVTGKTFKLGAGDFFGEMALITGEQRSADVTALDYSRFATLSARDFRHFLHRFPDIRQQIAQLAAERKEMNQNAAEG